MSLPSMALLVQSDDEPEWQSMPEGVEVTEPDPLPDVAAVSVNGWR